MEAKAVWLALFVAVYWAYCLVCGATSARSVKTASDYFIAGRRLRPWVFVLAATATSFSGWTFMGHPGLIYRDGFQYAYASFYAIAIPFTGVLFLRRQWMLGKRFGYVTPGEMLSRYFQGDAIRVLTVAIAVLFSVPYLGLQLGASGYLLEVVTDGVIDRDFAMWALALVVLLYVAWGGLRAVAYADVLQCGLLALGIVITGLIAYVLVGGWSGLNDGLARLAVGEAGRWGATAEGHNAYFAIPGVIQFTAGLGKETPAGGLWTGVMVLTYLFALMGIQSAPAFSMWAFSSASPRAFAPQQVWASSLLAGLVLFFFTTAQGMGAHLLGMIPPLEPAGAALSSAVPEAVGEGMDPEAPYYFGALVPYYFGRVAAQAPWLVGLLALGALSAMQSTGAAYMSTAGSMLTRDLYQRYLNPTASHASQILFGRLGVVAIVLAALVLTTFLTDVLMLLGGLAVAFGLQMWPALAGACWFPWITRQGVLWGLVAGLAGVVLTDAFGLELARAIGIDLPWGRWPWTIHSAGWGIACNVFVCALVSAATQDPAARRHRMRFHDFLRRHGALSPSKRHLLPIAWAVTLAWFFFAVGPGAVLGNTLFGDPAAGRDGWTFGMPSIWAWQILFWLLGVGMMWLLAYRMEMSTAPSDEVEPLVDDIGDVVPAPGVRRQGG